MKKILLVLIVLFVSLSSYSKTLKVAMHESPPFVMDDVNGSYTGLTVDMWEKTAHELGIDYEYVPYHGSINSMVDEINKGEFDVGLGSITINSNRLKKCNFLQPFYVTHVSIASNVAKSNVLVFLSNLFSLNFVKYVLSLIILLYVIGFLIWLVERKKNDDFSESFLEGLTDGFYFASVVMTTVGFGDKSAKTSLGRIIVIFWMFISLGITGIFIGNISSAITVNRLDTGIDSINDLHKTKVGSILNSTSAYFLETKGVKFIGYHSVEEGLQDIEDGNLETFVYDTPILKYYISKNKYKISLSNVTFDMQYYGIPLNVNDELEKAINCRMVDYIDSDLWNLTLAKYNLN